MKKSIIVWLMIADGLLLNLYSCEQQRYPRGRDTYAQFGNGRFSVGITYDYNDHRKIYGLYDNEIMETIVSDVYSFRQDGYMVYAYGTKKNNRIYVILNYASGKYIESRSVEQAPIEFRRNLSILSTNRTLPN